MKCRFALAATWMAAALLADHACANDRRFTYVYEPETMPAGGLEYENWVTLRAGRTADTGQDNFNRWDLRQELEYGVTDRYTIGFYLNERSQSYEDPVPGTSVSEFEFRGVSLENRYNILNPAEHTVGFTAYLEGTYAGEDAELEQKLIFGQRHGDWKWALNLEHATEWEDQLSEVEGELGASAGIAREFGTRWSFGLELRYHALLPDYSELEKAAIFAGPVARYRQDKWWATLTILPQIHGWNYHSDPDNNSNLELTSHEKLNIRFLIGFDL